jgi:WD40 repeat protein
MRRASLGLIALAALALGPPAAADPLPAGARPLTGHRGRVTSVVAAPDGKTVVTAGEDKTVRAWDPTTGKEKWKATFPDTVRVTFATADVAVVEYERVFSGLAEPLIDLATGKTKPLPGDMGKEKRGSNPLRWIGPVVTRDTLLAIAPDGKSAVTYEPQDQELRVWSWPAGELKKTMPHGVPHELVVWRVRARFTPDGKELLTATDCHLLRPPPSGPPYTPVFVDRNDMTKWKWVERKKLDEACPVWAADGSRLFVVLNKGEVEEAFTGKSVARLPHDNVNPFIVWTLGGMALSPDGKTIAIGGSFFSPGSVRLFALRAGGQTATLPAGGRGRLEVAFLPDGRIVTIGETALIWPADADDRTKPPEKR